ncbi:MAG: site-2 protease family protein [Pseudomonadota bacterium]
MIPTDLNEFFLNIVIMAIPILMAVTVHEYAHGLAAFKLGDPTAKNAGRLTLNPIKHLDLVGTLVFLITRMVGWAKPVPVDPRYFRRPRQDMIWVSAAGPAANILLAAVFGQVYRLAAGDPLLPSSFLEEVAVRGVIINVGLALFNLLPIPPLDGSGILTGLLPLNWAIKYEQLRPYGFIILLVLIFTNLIGKLLFPLILTLAQFLVGGL